MLSLRPYQRDAIDALFSQWQTGEASNNLVVLPTGSGKSLVIAAIVQELLELYPLMRIGVVTHSKELIAQNFQELLKIWPQAPAGIYSAGIGRRDTRAAILFCGIQSVWNKVEALGKFDLLLIDEAHLISRNADTMYGKFMDALRQRQPDMRAVGLTATPFRLDSGRLDEGDERLFDKIIYEANVADLIHDGFLSPLVSKGTHAEIGTKGLHKRGGEFIAGELEAAAMSGDLVSRAAAEIVSRGTSRKAWLAFCSGIDHSMAVRDAIRAHGVSCEAVDGTMRKPERDGIIQRFRQGQIKCLTSVNVLSIGFNVPHVDLVALLRPTESAGLYIQQVGRGFRMAPGKENCIAEGSRVLTDCGLIEIQNVKSFMKVWDGVEFVSHCGTVFRGEQEVISYAGLTATEDHKVWTKEGWKPFGECARKQTSIAVTEFGGTNVQLSESCFRGDCTQRKVRQTSPSNGVFSLWRSITERLHKRENVESRMSQVWQSSAGAKVAFHEGDFCKAALHQSKRWSLRTIWSAWNTLQFWFPNGYGALGSGELGVAQGIRVGPHRQRQTLRGGELEVSLAQPKSIQYARAENQSKNAQIQDGLPTHKICRQYIAKHAWKESDDARASSGSVSQKICKTKRRVWDILNAGPRHSFTVEGFLVHNCLVLDFAGNVRRHGPVDMVEGGFGGKPKGEGKGDAEQIMAKTCPNCQSIVHIRVMECPDCGHTWESAPKHEAKADDAPIMSGRDRDGWAPVKSVNYLKHVKRASSSFASDFAASEQLPPTMRASYLVGGIKTVSEWFCFSHPQGSMPQRKAATFWLEAGGCSPIPVSVDEALARVDELRAVEAVKYSKDKNSGFDRVTARRFSSQLIFSGAA